MAACAARRGTHGVQRPDLDTARLILESGADVNLGSPLFKAAYCNHVDVVRLLLEFRAEVDRRDMVGHDPPHRGREGGARRVRARPLGRGRRRRRERGGGQARAVLRVLRGPHIDGAAPSRPRRRRLRERLAETPSAPFCPAIDLDKDKRKNRRALLATMRARTARLEAENAPRRRSRATRLTRGSRLTITTRRPGDCVTRRPETREEWIYYGDEPNPTSPAARLPHSPLPRP